MKVFLADDSAVTRQRLAEMVRNLNNGMEVCGEAASAGEAIRGIHQAQPDVVVLDIRMPEGGGLLVLDVIKREQSRTVFIVFTNYPHPHYRQRCMELGAEYFLDKSKDIDELSQILVNLAAGRQVCRVGSGG